MIRESIRKAVLEALKNLGHTDKMNVVVERPGSFEHGDYATNAAITASAASIVYKNIKTNPLEIAQNLKKELDGKIPGVELAVAPPGFINFFLSREVLVKEVEQAATQAEWGNNELYKGKKIMVEYTDPNPFKEFHIGHLMSNAIGEAVARVLEAASADVKRANYQGDVGPHVAKAIWGKMQKPEMSWGEAYVYGNEQYEGHKEEIDAVNKKVYDKSDEQINKLYADGREQSLKHFEEIYKTLGTTFDHYFFESETAPVGLELVKKHSEIFEESEGAIIYKGPHTRVFVNSQDLPTYEAKEVGLAKLKQEREPSDTYVYVTANEQNGFFEVVFEAIQKVFPDLAGKLMHCSHGMMRFAEGKMSSRVGNVITGESLIKDLTVAARNREDVAVGAVKYAVLKQNSGKDIVFDQEKSLSLEGDSGPYVQYAHTRALSLIKEAEKVGIRASTVAGSGEMNTSPTPSPTTVSARNVLERALIHFPDVLARAARELEPHYVTTYITELASAFNSWYTSEKLIGGKNPEYGLLLTQAVEKTLAKGLHVLGIPAPEKM